MAKYTRKSKQSAELATQTNIESRRPRVGRSAAIGGAALVVMALLAACGPAEDEGNKPPTTIETPADLTVDQLIQQNVENRPAVGSPEYQERVTDALRIPYIPNQAPEDVVRNLEESVRDYLELGYEDAPQTSEEITDWQVENNTSLRDLMDLLDLEYYNPGIQEGIFGGADSTYGQTIMERFDPYRIQRLGALMENALEYNSEMSQFDAGIRSASGDRITGISSATFGVEGAAPVELTYGLTAVDTNGNGVLDEGDSWVWTDDGQ